MLRRLFNPLKKYIQSPGDEKLRLRIDITNKCNLLCEMCFYRNTVNEPKYDMPVPLFQKIADEILPYAEWASIACQYEAFMSKNIDEILEIISKNPCKRIGIVSNGLLMNEKRSRQILSNGAIETLNISIDGATKETYERIRVKGRWEALMKNLEDFRRLKDEMQLSTPALLINTVLMKSNINELPAIIDLAKTFKAARVQAIRYVRMRNDLDEEISDLKTFLPIFAEAKKKAHSYGIQLFLPIHDPSLDIEGDCETESKCNVSEIGNYSQFCEAPWRALQINPNGDVFPCGFFGKPFGNLTQNSFAEIWNNENFLELRRSLALLKLKEQCKICNPHGYDKMEHKGKTNI